jgi:diazepam-binding inhibitor (GABA receptor modulating acyl-CoA-binding protein)
MDSTESEFETYVELFKEGGELRYLVDKESQQIRLSLYAHGRQGKLGDVNTTRPGIFSPVERAKWDAWNEVKGMDQKAAKEKFVAMAKIIAAKK